jgi:hypothetical protein
MLRETAVLRLSRRDEASQFREISVPPKPRSVSVNIQVVPGYDTTSISAGHLTKGVFRRGGL